MSPASPFGPMLRQWRAARGVSQLDLATRAEVSQRHISFLETGRSRPSPEMVVHLGRVLEVPPREQNLLLTAAGHAPEYRETPLDELDHIVGVLDHMLAAHQPNAAIVVNRRWDLVRANAAAMAFTARLFPEPPPWAVPVNVMRLSFHPDGLRRHMVGWGRTAAALLRRLERDTASHPHDAGLAGLLAEVKAYPDVATLGQGARAAAAADLLVPATYVIDGEEVALFTTIARIGDAHDLTLEELRLETFWPLDEQSAERWGRLFG